MFKNYFITAWRNITRHKLFSFINVFGLSLGITACLLIFLISNFELSFNKGFSDHERIFRLVSNGNSATGGETHSGSVPDPAPFVLRKELSGIASIAVFSNYVASVSVHNRGVLEKFNRPERDKKASDIVIAEPEFFNVFKYEWLAGDPATLKEPYQVVLTQSKARLYFGERPDRDYLQKVLFYNDSLTVTVSGIVKDAGSNTDILFNDFISFTTIKNSFLKNEFSSNDWNGSRTNHQAFVKLNEHVGESAVNQLLTAFAKRYVPQEAGSHTTFKLQPLSALHFDADYADVYTRKASMPSLYGLTGIAVFILLIAIVNFITLATAQSMDRAKETGIRKISGSTRSSLIIRFLCETFLLTAIAIAVAAGSLQIVLSNFKSFLPDGVSSTVFSINTWIFIGIVALITTIAAGFYPAKVLSSVAPGLSVKGSTIQQGPRKSYLVKGLIVFQFAVSLFFIICTMVVGRQVNFMLNKDLGFSKDAIININTNEAYAPAKKHFLAEQIRQLSGVDKVSMSDGTPAATHHWENPLVLSSDPQRTASCILEWGDEHFLPLYNIPVIAGRNLAPSDTIREFIINESCVKALGFTDPKEVIGKYVETITPGGSVSRPVVGVMRDFHSQSLHKAIQPVIFTSSAAFTRGINVKLRSTGMDQFTSSIAQIEKVFKQVYPDEIFEYTFFDQTIAQFYEQEKQTSMLMSFATGIAICISCLGLFGLAALTARQRRKEIGIRKVLGAGVGNLVLLLNKDLFRLVFIAILIATPVALLFMVRWLNSFSFRIGIDWWIFLLAAGIALLVAFCAVAFQSVKAALSNPVDVIRDK